MRTDALTALALAVLVAGCSKSEPSNEGKRMPKPPPVKSAAIPVLEIAVSSDGSPRPPITRETLAQLDPDWSDNLRRAWRISRVVGVESSLETSFAITNSNDLTVEFPAMSSTHALVPALLLSQRGGIVAEFIDPVNPFPAFHGEGGRLGRSPEVEPRVSGVVKIDVRRRTKTR